MSKKKIRILGTGSFLAAKCVTNKELEQKLHLQSGWIDKNCGVKTRYHVDGEEASELGAKAAKKALDTAGLKGDQLDLVIGVSGVPQQAIPSMSALLHKKLGLKKTQTFDVNSTCLSFLSGLSIGAKLIESGEYHHILLVAADVASVGLNPDDPKTASLFGDGAAAVIIGPSNDSSAHIKVEEFETWTENQEACLFESGGTKLYLKDLSSDDRHRQYFQMNGPKLYKTAIPHSMKMIDRLLETAATKIQDLDVLIPHQASPLALQMTQKKLRKKYGDFSCQFVNVVQNFGNMIATSIPHALDYAIRNHILKRGDKCLMIGTSAGLSVGGMILEY